MNELIEQLKNNLLPKEHPNQIDSVPFGIAVDVVYKTYTKAIDDAIEKIDEKLEKANGEIGWGSEFVTITSARILTFEQIIKELQQLKESK